MVIRKKKIGHTSSLIVAFLVLNLALGLWYGKGIKLIHDFALGGRYFSTMTLAATLISTWIGGGTFDIILCLRHILLEY